VVVVSSSTPSTQDEELEEEYEMSEDEVVILPSHQPSYHNLPCHNGNIDGEMVDLKSSHDQQPSTRRGRKKKKRSSHDQPSSTTIHQRLFDLSKQHDKVRYEMTW